MALTLDRVKKDGTALPPQRFAGRRAKPRPPRPELSALTFGEPVALFDGKSLSGWRLTQPDANNAWGAATRHGPFNRNAQR